MIPETNRRLECTKTQQLTMLEFFVFIGCIFSWLASREFQIAEIGGHHYLLTCSNVNPFCLNEYMSLQFFEDIMQALCFTNLPHPPYTDQYHDVCQLIDKLNEHYMEIMWQVGFFVLMKAWTFGWTSGCVCHKNHIHLAMNIIQSEMVIWRREHQ